MEFRLATPEDYETTEGITRESFWNKYQPGADEHYLLHKIRQSPDYLPELSYVAIVDDHVVGCIVYTKASLIESTTGYNYPILSFGPVSVLPSYQGQGIGTKLIQHSLKQAESLGYSGVVLYGDPRFYRSYLNFSSSEKYEILTREGAYATCLLAYPLQNDLWSEMMKSGEKKYFQESNSFENFMEGFEEYERNFPEKEKFVTDSQREFDVLRSLTFQRGPEREGEGGDERKGR
jgi:putative acetyltransferase